MSAIIECVCSWLVRVVLSLALLLAAIAYAIAALIERARRLLVRWARRLLQ